MLVTSLGKSTEQPGDELLIKRIWLEQARASVLSVLTMVAPRVYDAMSKDRAFFPILGRLHPRFGTPANAVLLQERRH